MRDTLNLLDPSHRHALAHERMMFAVKDAAFLTLGTAALIATLLTLSKVALTRDLEESTARANVVSTKNKPMQKAIREINDELKAVALIDEEYTSWSSWLILFSRAVPQGNHITNIILDRQQRNIALSGHSIRREDLLAFKEMLEQSGLIKEMQFPLANLLARDDIDFKFSATIELDARVSEPARTSL